MGGTHLGDYFWHAVCGPPTPPAPPLPPSITSRPVKIHVRGMKICESFGGARLGGVLGGISWRIEQTPGGEARKSTIAPR